MCIIHMYSSELRESPENNDEHAEDSDVASELRDSMRSLWRLVPMNDEDIDSSDDASSEFSVSKENQAAVLIQRWYRHTARANKFRAIVELSLDAHSLELGIIVHDDLSLSYTIEILNLRFFISY